jgi:hypothetical protein
VYVPERNRVTKQQTRARQNDSKEDEESERRSKRARAANESGFGSVVFTNAKRESGETKNKVWKPRSKDGT